MREVLSTISFLSDSVRNVRSCLGGIQTHNATVKSEHLACSNYSIQP